MYHHNRTSFNLTQYRAYTADFGRWISRDPIEENGGLSLYAYVTNDPIDRYDELGLLDFVFDKQYPTDKQAAVNKAIETLKSTTRGKELTDADPGRIIKIAPTDSKHRTSSQGDYIYLNPNDPAFLDCGSRRDFGRYPSELPPPTEKGRAVTLGHELGHAVTHQDDERHYGGINHNVRDNENPIRQQLGLDRRESYSGTPVYRY
jgi:RHS repeat-associated protein